MAEDLLICQGQNEDYNKYGVPGSLLERFLNQMYTVLTRPHSRAHKTPVWNATTLLHLKTLTEVFILDRSHSAFSNIKGTYAIKEYLQNRSRNAENKNHSEAHYSKISPVGTLVYYLPVHLLIRFYYKFKAQIER